MFCYLQLILLLVFKDIHVLIIHYKRGNEIIVLIYLYVGGTIFNIVFIMLRGDRMFEKSSEELASNKLYILYILKRIEIPLTNGQITEVFMKNDLLDYFSLQQYILQLKESKLIQSSSEKGVDYFFLTESGSLALEYFNNRIDEKAKKSLDLYIEINKEDILRDREIKADFKKDKFGEYDVILQILDNKVPYMKIELKVPTNNTAQIICENWKDAASEKYSSIIETLINRTEK